MNDFSARSAAYLARAEALDKAQSEQNRIIANTSFVVWLVFLLGLQVLWFATDMSTRKLVAWVVIALGFRYIVFRVWINHWALRRMAKLDAEFPAPPGGPFIERSGHEDHAGHG